MNRFLRRRAKRDNDQVILTRRGRALLELRELARQVQTVEALHIVAQRHGIDLRTPHQPGAKS